MKEAVDALVAASVPMFFPAAARKACVRAGLDRSLRADETDGFDLAHYERQVGHRFRSVHAALFHFLLIGSRRGLQPRAGFDPAGYRRRNPDIDPTGYEPFAHYLHFGRHEGRGAMPLADAPDDSSLSPPDIARISERRSRNPGAATVDVIVPVYGGRDLALQTIDSVLSADGKVACELVVVDDASPDARLRAELRDLAGKGLLTLLENERNVGFVGSVNRGLSLHAGRDVVLLNSDTKVFPGWLDRLMAALHSTPRTATATPLSNAATILSYPIPLRDNHRLPGLDFADLDRLCAQLGQPPVELPTAIGFCMAIKRACLEEVGVFDAARFGRGYGEENDFCLRAVAAGWRHVAATSVFVWHRGGASFGAGREAMIAAAQETLERLHPGYAASIQRFIQRDPLRSVRTALDIMRIRDDPRRKVLSPVPDAPAGEGNELVLAVVPDIEPFFGQYRIRVPGFPPVPNLPRIDPAAPVASVAETMKALDVRELQVVRVAGSAS